MAKKKEDPGQMKLLDLWIPPENAGLPVGCLATSFTFNSVHFEEQCLSRFLGMATDANEDKIIYIIEREEKLASIECASALIDERHAKGPRSLRWDLIPIRIQTNLGKGAQHAKISVLRWEHCMRFIFTSANLTGDGYRRNQEVVGSLDYYDGSASPLAIVQETKDFLIDMLSFAKLDRKLQYGAHNRTQKFIDDLGKIQKSWGDERPTSTLREPRVYSAFVNPKKEISVFDRLRETWPQGRPNWAEVVSPFYNAESKENDPALCLWNLLNKRGQAEVAFNILGDKDEQKKEIFFNAPPSIERAKPANRSEVDTHFKLLSSEDTLGDLRPLHAKAITLKNDSWTSYLLGSSNFTSPGTGIAISNPKVGRNFEANLIYQANLNRDRPFARQIASATLTGEEIPDDWKIKFKTKSEEADETDDDFEFLPSFFQVASYSTNDKKQAIIRFTFEGKLDRAWEIRTVDGTVVLNSRTWVKSQSQSECLLRWDQKLPPVEFYVYWESAKSMATWPVNIESFDDLPPPEELRDLKLADLLEILQSARPIYEVMRNLLKKNILKEVGSNNNGELIDPHKRVDTSKFLLQRTRRVSRALLAIREKLERPVPTEESLRWRLFGPVGVRAVAEAIEKEAHSQTEKAFLLTELYFELSKVAPKSNTNSMSLRKVKILILEVMKEVKAQITETKKSSDLEKYCSSIFKEVEK